MTTLGEVLEWQFPGVEGISTRGGELMDFPSTPERPRPTDAELAAWAQEFEATAMSRRRASRRQKIVELLNSDDLQIKLLTVAIRELIDEIRAIKVGQPKPSRTMPQLMAAVAARIAAGEAD